MAKEYIEPCDMVGERFGKLTVCRFSGSRQGKSGNKERTWLCKCDCGNEIIATGRNLRAGRYVSCGCAKSERYTKRNTTHGGAIKGKEERLYSIWRSMKRRCSNPKDSRYHRYGGRGISVCEEWEKDYAKFREWALSNGYDPLAPFGNCTIDRIDNDGNYEPDNCRWVDMKAQANNTSKQKDGERRNDAAD